MLTRLVDKQVVREAKQGNTSLYDPLISQRKARSVRFVRCWRRPSTAPMGPLVHFLVEEERLSPKQKRELAKIMQDEAKGKGETK
jgi:predicted transcriptional regulator